VRNSAILHRREYIKRNDYEERLGELWGSDLATDNGATITVATGTVTFTIKKANFNWVDVVDVGSTHVVLTSASANRGLVMFGPDQTASFPANVTCGTGGGNPLYPSNVFSE